MKHKDLSPIRVSLEEVVKQMIVLDRLLQKDVFSLNEMGMASDMETKLNSIESIAGRALETLTELQESAE